MTKLTGKIVLNNNIHDFPYDGKSCMYLDGKYMEDVDITSIADWTNIVIPYYSWNGCGGVYLFKPAADVPGCPYVDIGMYVPDSCRMWYDTLEYESSSDYEYDIDVFAEKISNSEMKAIREQIISRQKDNRQ